MHIFDLTTVPTRLVDEPKLSEWYSIQVFFKSKNIKNFNSIIRFAIIYPGMNLFRRKTPGRIYSTINNKENILEFLFWKLSRYYLIPDLN